MRPRKSYKYISYKYMSYNTMDRSFLVNCVIDNSLSLRIYILISETCIKIKKDRKKDLSILEMFTRMRMKVIGRKLAGKELFTLVRGLIVTKHHTIKNNL